MTSQMENFTAFPAGCVLHPVADEDTAPLLRCGDFAVVDTNDRDPVVGELYVIEQDSPLMPMGKRRRIVEVCLFGDATLADGSPALMVGPYARNEFIPGIGAARMLDGAYSAAGLRSQLIGRIIGISDTLVASSRVHS
jgi:hypothetical protein